MNRKIIFSSIPFILILFTFLGCKKNTEKIVGPEYIVPPANFSVVGNKLLAYNTVRLSGYHFTTPSKSVNIQTQYQYYTATFSNQTQVSWTLTITSWKSGAQKVFTGISSYLDSTNTKWDGGTSNNYFFGFSAYNDSAEVKLTFTGSDLMVRDTIAIIGLKNYYGQTYNGIFHYMVDDFEGNNAATAFSSFYPDLQDIGGGNTGNNGCTTLKNEGNFSYYMFGNDTDGNTYIGSCNTPTLNDFPPNTFKTTDPAQLYINLYIYGTGKANTTVDVIVYENDANQAQGTTFNQNANDKYIYQIGVTWTGWQLVSFNYSQFKVPNTGGGLGNNQLNPNRLCGMALELDSYPTQSFEVSAYVDMVVVTENGIFQK
jgi:hypothetical protein